MEPQPHPARLEGGFTRQPSEYSFHLGEKPQNPLVVPEMQLRCLCRHLFSDVILCQSHPDLFIFLNSALLQRPTNACMVLMTAAAELLRDYHESCPVWAVIKGSCFPWNPQKWVLSSFTRWGSLSEVQHLSYGHFSHHGFLSTKDRALFGLVSKQVTAFSCVRERGGTVRGTEENGEWYLLCSEMYCFLFM